MIAPPPVNQKGGRKKARRSSLAENGRGGLSVEVGHDEIMDVLGLQVDVLGGNTPGGGKGSIDLSDVDLFSDAVVTNPVPCKLDIGGHSYNSDSDYEDDERNRARVADFHDNHPHSPHKRRKGRLLPTEPEITFDFSALADEGKAMAAKQPKTSTSQPQGEQPQGEHPQGEPEQKAQQMAALPIEHLDDVTNTRYDSGNPNAPNLRIDVLDYMKKGTPFLKYGRKGFPHFRQMQLTKDNQAIQWYSGKKKLSASRVYLKDIQKLQKGQSTAVFSKHNVKSLERSSFSLIYDNGKRTLDLIAKDPNDFTVWVHGLKVLMRFHEQGKLTTTLSEIIMQMPILKNRRSSIDLPDVDSGLTADDIGGPSTETKRNARMAAQQDKSIEREVLKKFAKLQKDVLKLTGKVESRKVRSHAEYPNMVVCLYVCVYVRMCVCV
jgi:hypothetical protein